ncbi:MAG: glutamate--tRNA ligase [Alphaproteobacteria bacterium]
MTIVTRFAPSPSGFLHIGGARTALFNWLFARHFGGQFKLRIEDTDRKRSTEPAITAILEGLKWLELEWDGDPIYQYSRSERHREVVEMMLKSGHAYKCYATPEELQAMRDAASAEGKRFRYDGRWRDRDPGDAPKGIEPAIRLKAPQTGETVILDKVQSEVRVANNELDDMVLLRADGTPTYMLAVVVDDHDMGITHVIRGDDHLNNAFRQAQVFNALNWSLPEFAHIPLIHGADGSKLSKRHGALGVDAYRDMGLLPAAVRNYLLRLGWSHGDQEIFSTEEAISLFDLSSVNRAAARFDLTKLESVNSQYLRETSSENLFLPVIKRLETETRRMLSDIEKTRVKDGLESLKSRAKTLVDLSEMAQIYLSGPPIIKSEKAEKMLSTEDALASLSKTLESLKTIEARDWNSSNIENMLRSTAEVEGLKLGNLAQPLRAALTGLDASPSLFEVAALLGKDETLLRIENLLT